LRSFSGRASVIGGMKGFSLRKSPSCADFMEFVDVFFVDEAGQLSLAKFWPCAAAGRSLVLLGDLQQLKQPQKGSHPKGSDISALAHLLDGRSRRRTFCYLVQQDHRECEESLRMARRSRMLHSGLEALQDHWDKTEYAAGYRARFSAIPDSEAAHHCWRTGWEDADTELLESARHNRILAEGREDDYAAPGVYSLTQAAPPARMASPSMKNALHLGKRAG
jgi:hypothetical protein